MSCVTLGLKVVGRMFKKKEKYMTFHQGRNKYPILFVCISNKQRKQLKNKKIMLK